MGAEFQENPLEPRREDDATVDAARRLVLGVPSMPDRGAEGAEALAAPARSTHRHLRAARLQ